MGRARIVFLLGAVMVGGCTERLRRTQLERVAKDWCETIRASQVIPVYPLTEDLRPGDVFLVRNPIASQQSEWKERGFLALDDFRVRLGKGKDGALPDMYAGMYFDGYWEDAFGDKVHPRPVHAAFAARPEPGARGNGGSGGGNEQPLVWLSSDAEAPRAAFPSYSFQVRSGSGMSLAIPIQGVPVGLSFMRTGNADGSVSLTGAFTYAGDPHAIHELLMDWTRAAYVRDQLYDAARLAAPNPVFLRVVTRVYLIGEVAVSLSNAESAGGQARAGADVQAPMFDAQGDFNEKHKKLLEALNEQANKPLPVAGGKPVPGGAVKFAWATERSVSMTETFDTPLVIGYLGFDVPVFANDARKAPEFGYPLPTWSVVTERIAPPTSATVADSGLRLDAIKPLALSAKESEQREALRIMSRSCAQLGAEGKDQSLKQALTRTQQQADALLAQQAVDDAWHKAVAALYTQFEVDTAFAAGGPDGELFNRILETEYNRRNR